MKKSLYRKLKNAFDSMISSKQKKLENIENEYLSDNGMYDVDQKVELWKWGEKKGDGIVVGTEFKDEDKLDTQPIIHRVDKDGKKLRTRWWSWYNYDEIKKID